MIPNKVEICGVDTSKLEVISEKPANVFGFELNAS